MWQSAPIAALSAQPPLRNAPKSRAKKLALRRCGRWQRSYGLPCNTQAAGSESAHQGQGDGDNLLPTQSPDRDGGIGARALGTGPQQAHETADGKGRGRRRAKAGRQRRETTDSPLSAATGEERGITQASLYP